MYMEVGRHQRMMANEYITVGSNSNEKVKALKYLGSLLTNQNPIQKDRIGTSVESLGMQH